MSDLYLECNYGISGDMAVAALLDAGADRTALEKALASIPVKGFKTEIKRVEKNGVFAGIPVTVKRSRKKQKFGEKNVTNTYQCV